MCSSKNVAVMILDTGYGLRATGYGLRATGYGLRATGYGTELPPTAYCLPPTAYCESPRRCVPAPAGRPRMDDRQQVPAVQRATASSSLLPMATARLRLRPTSFARVIALPFTSARRSSSVRRHRVDETRQVETGTRLPWCIARMSARADCTDRPPDRCRTRTRDRRSRLDAPRESTSAARWSDTTGTVSNPAYPGSTSAPVGQASRQRVQLPHCSSPCVSGSSGRVQMISPRNSHDPISGLIRHVFLPIHPRPAYCAYTRSCTGPVST